MSDQADDLKEAFGDIFGKWFWVTAGCLAVGIVVLTVVWYAQHSDQSPFTQWQPKRGPLSVPQTNGHVSAASASVGDDALEDVEEG